MPVYIVDGWCSWSVLRQLGWVFVRPSIISFHLSSVSYGGFDVDSMSSTDIINLSLAGCNCVLAAGERKTTCLLPMQISTIRCNGKATSTFDICNQWRYSMLPCHVCRRWMHLCSEWQLGDSWSVSSLEYRFAARSLLCNYCTQTDWKTAAMSPVAALPLCSTVNLCQPLVHLSR